MENNKKILFVDDDKRYADLLVERAYIDFKYDLHHCEDWEEAKSILEKGDEIFLALILDGRGKLNQGDKGDNPKHLATALKDIRTLNSKGIFIPYVINTAYYEEFTTYFSDENMVDKNDTEKLFSILSEIIANSDIEKLKSIYPEIFECFGGKYLPKDALNNYLIEVLLQIESKSWSKSSFNSLRKLIETIYKRLNEINEEIIPFSCLNYDKGNVNFDYCAKRLYSGKDIYDKNGKMVAKAVQPIIPKHLGWLIHPFDQVCSICSHDYKDINYLNIYSLKTVLFGVMEMILWFKNYIDENYE